MLTSTPIELPLPVVWSPPGPFNVEIDELGMGFDLVAFYPEFLPAVRKARELLRGWEIRGDTRRIRLYGPTGDW